MVSFPQVSPSKLLLSPIRATYPAHPILLDLITRTIFGEHYRSFSSTDHSSLQIIHHYRSFSTTDHSDHSALQIIQQYRSFITTYHSALQIIQQYRSFSTTDHSDHSALQIIQQYRSLSFSLYNLLHAPVTSSLLGPDVLLNTRFSHTLGLRSSLSVSDQFTVSTNKCS